MTRYYFYVFAFAILLPSIITSSYSQQHVTTPSAVGELVAIPGNNEVLLTWVALYNGGSTIKSFKVIMWEVGKEVTTTYPNILPTSTQAKITGLTNGIPYSFQVIAVNDQGAGEPSYIVTTTPTTSSNGYVPEKITDLRVMRGDQKVTLTWSAPFNFGNKITSYTIYFWEADSNEIKTKSVTGDAGSAQITGLKNEVSYSFKIIAKNSFGHGPESNVVFQTPSKSSSAEVPNRVRGVNAIASNSQVFLSWVEPSSNGSPITNYQVLVSEFGSDVVTTYPNVGKDTKTTITGLKNGVKYSFRIVAVNSVGPSQPSSQITATPENYVSIEITNLRASRGDGFVTLTWSIPSFAQEQISGYYIREYKTGESKFTTHVILDKTTKVKISGLENGVSYGFSVMAVTDSGVGPVSNIVNVTPMKANNPAGTPEAISDLKGIVGQNQVTLTWSAPNDFGNPITGYQIQQKAKGDNFFSTLNYGTSTSANISGLTSGVTYDFKVIAKNSVGLGTESNVISITPSQLQSGISIPSWIKTNAQWWSQDLISDVEYVRAIEFLINEGIIKIK